MTKFVCFIVLPCNATKGDKKIMSEKRATKRRNCLPISFSCPMDLLDIIEADADENGKSRSEMIVEVLKEKYQPVKK